MLKRVSLWDRGVYIHRKYVTKDKQWVDEVQELAYELLKKEEFIHFAKLYRLVKDEAQKRNVPSEYALYSLMRYYDKEIVSLPRFPNILPYGANLLENEAWLVKYIRDKKRPVSIGELKEEFVEAKGWRDFRSEEHTSELQSRGHLVCRLLLE